MKTIIERETLTIKHEGCPGSGHLLPSHSVPSRNVDVFVCSHCKKEVEFPSSLEDCEESLIFQNP